MKTRLPSGYTLSTTLVPKTSSNQKGKFFEAHDYKAQGQIVDFVVIMTYDWGWQGGPPMAISYWSCKRSTSICKISNASTKNYDGAKFIWI